MPIEAIQFFLIVWTVVIATCVVLLSGFFAAFSNDFDIEE